MPNQIFAGRGTSVFEVMSRLAIANGAVNLGQGFPDEDGPLALREAAARALIEGPNQYPPMLGIPELRRAVADAGRRFWGLDLDWESEVLVTCGATEALTDCFLALTEPGDEVILIEPFYDSYLPIAERAGAVVKTVALEPPDWRLPLDALEAAFSGRTKLILLNNPHNPTAKVFTREELEAIARLIRRHDAYAVCDEVYEHITFDNHRHTPLLTLEDVRDRVVRIGSAGKTFSFTGWKVGYLSGPRYLVEAIAKAHQFVTFTTPPALQRAVAEGLAGEDAYFDGLAASMQRKRDRFTGALQEAGFATLPCGGTYFVNIDIRSVGFSGTDEEFCRDIIEKAGVAAIPLSAFYRPASEGTTRSFARFCFAKRDAVLDEAARRLAAYAGRRRS